MRPAASIRPVLARLVAVAVLATGIAVGPAVGSSLPQPHAVAPGITQLEVRGVDAAAARSAPEPRFGPGDLAPGSRMVALTPQRRTAPFVVLGLTWEGVTPPGLVVNVRVRSDGRWSGWQEVHADASHAPNSETSEGRQQRLGTEPLVVGRADGVQVRVDSSTSAPRGLRAVLVDPGSSPADDAAGTATAAPAAPAGLAGASAAAYRPAVNSRASWGADESLRDHAPEYGTIRAAFVHHTAGTNSYTSSQVPSIIRGIYAYHVKGRGWNDIGYNFLVDKWGRIWEGRYGGVDKAVIGAHTRGYNEEAFAMATLGDFTSTAPSTAVVTAYSRLFSWKLGLSYLDPTTTTVMTGDDGNHTFRRVSGHRDANSTSCPGAKLYAHLPTIRSQSKARQGTMFYHPTMAPRAWRAGGAGTTVTGPVSTSMTWRVRVYTCSGTLVASQSGTSSTATGLTATWNARLSKTGGFAPPGYYTVVVSGTSGSNTPAQALPWSGTVRIDGPDGSLPPRCP